MNNHQGRHTAQLHRARRNHLHQSASKRLWGTVLITLTSAAALALTSVLNWPTPSALTPKGHEMLLITQNLHYGALLLTLSAALSLILKKGLPALRWALVVLYAATWYWIWPSAPTFLNKLLTAPHTYPGPLLFLLAGMGLLAAALFARGSGQ